MSLRLTDVPADGRAVLREELAAFADAQRAPAAAAPYRALVEAVEAGEVPDSLVSTLDSFLELSLYRGRLRRQRGAEADDALTALFFKAPTGAAARQAAHQVTRALGTLAGHVVERVSVAAVVGGHTVTIETDRTQLVLELDRGGARIKSVEVSA